MLFFLCYSGPVLMSYLADAFSDLLRLLRQWAQMLTDLTAWDRIVQSTPTRLREVRDFGSNPGNLRMFTYAPDPLPSSAALVVVLHGCTQTAVGYDHGAGWSTLADRYAFDLLFPEQQTVKQPGTLLQLVSARGQCARLRRGALDPADDRARHPDT